MSTDKTETKPKAQTITSSGPAVAKLRQPSNGSLTVTIAKPPTPPSK